MSGAAAAVQAALVAALSDNATLAAALSGVFDGPPARAAFPYLAIGPAVDADWSHKTGRGREHRLAVSIWDEPGAAARLHALMAATEDAIEGMARSLGGHRIVSLVFVRSRMMRDGEGPIAGVIEYRARTLEE